MGIEMVVFLDIVMVMMMVMVMVMMTRMMMVMLMMARRSPATTYVLTLKVQLEEVDED